VGGVQRTLYDASLEVSRSAGQPWVTAASGILFFDGTRRWFSLKGEQVPDVVLNDLAEAADLTQPSGAAEITFETARFRLTFKFRARYSI
jgi:hypothetical protein